MLALLPDVQKPSVPAVSLFSLSNTPLLFCIELQIAHSSTSNQTITNNFSTTMRFTSLIGTIFAATAMAAPGAVSLSQTSL
jgi:hypothetical protein